MFMELRAVFCHIFVFLLYISNAGVHIQDMLHVQCLFQCLRELSPHAMLLFILSQIDRCLNRPVIRGTLLKRSGIRVSDDLAIRFRDQIRIFLQNMCDPRPELLHRRHFIFECNRCSCHIRCVNI